MDPRPARLAALVERGMLDAELGALVWLLLEARVPTVVAGPPGGPRDALFQALVALVPTDARVVELAGGAEEFEWLPEATELGWRRERNVLPASGRDATPRATSSNTVLVATDLAGAGPHATTGARARLTVRALALGYGLIAAIDAVDLEAVLARLAAPDIATDADEQSRLGVVVTVADASSRSRIAAAHYIRPLARDQHGHLQRLPHAVLATWDMAKDSFDHFAWAVIPDLGARIGRTPLELEREQAAKIGVLRVPGGVVEPQRG